MLFINFQIMKKLIWLPLFILSFIFLSKTVSAQKMDVLLNDSSKFSILTCINEFDSSKKVDENTGWYYFFTDKAIQNGWYLKMSYVKPGQYRHGTHHHTSDEIIFILEGSAEITINNQIKTVGPNTSVYFPAGSEHGLKNTGNVPLKYLVIKKE